MIDGEIIIKHQRPKIMQYFDSINEVLGGCFRGPAEIIHEYMDTKVFFRPEMLPCCRLVEASKHGYWQIAQDAINQQENMPNCEECCGSHDVHEYPFPWFHPILNYEDYEGKTKNMFYAYVEASYHAANCGSIPILRYCMGYIPKPLVRNIAYGVIAGTGDVKLLYAVFDMMNDKTMRCLLKDSNCYGNIIAGAAYCDNLHIANTICIRYPSSCYGANGHSKYIRANSYQSLIVLGLAARGNFDAIKRYKDRCGKLTTFDVKHCAIYYSMISISPKYARSNDPSNDPSEIRKRIEDNLHHIDFTIETTETMETMEMTD